MTGVERFSKRNFKRRSIKELAGHYKGFKNSRHREKQPAARRKRRDYKRLLRKSKIATKTGKTSANVAFSATKPLPIKSAGY